jgi:hypothetical protein
MGLVLSLNRVLRVFFGFQVFKIVIGKANGDYPLYLVQLRYQVNLTLDRVCFDDCHNLAVGEYSVHLYAIEGADPFGNRHAGTLNTRN